MNIGILGGDLRQIHLYKLLKNKCGNVDILYNRITEKHCEYYDVILLPLPVSKDGLNLFAPFSEEKIKLDEIFNRYPSAYFLGGSISDKIMERALSNGRLLVDYYLDEILLEKNAVLTAQGTIELLKDELKAEKSFLIVGFGRIGKALCRLLKSIDIPFCITARKESDYIQMEALGYRWQKTEKIKDIISEYDYVINTVPSMVLSEAELKNCKAGCKILDLASAPYGTDFKYCDKKHITYSIIPGIPGKYYPKQAAVAIYETIMKFIKSEG